ncbi:uncharacterized protein [Palaemon carinicauda]|uniref:uncharacterized protein n=1 Tax=Palaemon carinicauda TaxID=392227 RepID=UPI0035B5E857
MDTWSFLIQHIVRGETVSSEQFRGSEGGAETVSDVDDDVRSTGSHSHASTSTRKDEGKGKGSSRTLDTTHSDTCVSEDTTHSDTCVSEDTTHSDTCVSEDTIHSDTCVSEKDFSNILRNLMSKADSIAPTFTGQHKIVHDFACLLEDYMHAIPVHRWHEFQIECLNLAHRYRDESQVFQQAQQQPIVTWAATLAAPSAAGTLAAPTAAATLAAPTAAATWAAPSAAATLAAPSTRTLAGTARAAAAAASSSQS